MGVVGAREECGFAESQCGGARVRRDELGGISAVSEMQV